MGPRQGLCRRAGPERRHAGDAERVRGAARSVLRHVMSKRAGRIPGVAALALSCAAALGIGVAAVPGAAAAGTATEKPATLQVLVTNDDGVGAPGIDALVQGLRKVKGVKLTVVAPAENKSGSSDTTTPG